MLSFRILIKSVLLLASRAAEITGDIMPGRPVELPGGDRDNNNCLISAGYSWCDSSQDCVRQWETPCSDNYVDCLDCLNRQKNGENIACPTYCDATTLNCNDDGDCLGSQFCRPTTVDSNGPKQCISFAMEGGSCGGYTLPSNQMRCPPSLECVNRLGPMIADSPGNCMRPCKSNGVRDSYGNCIQNEYPIPLDPLDPLDPLEPCPDVMCMMYCENEFQKDVNGCDMCLCNDIHNPECPIPYETCNNKVCPKVIEITHCSEGGVASFTTYQLSLVINDNNIHNIYAIFGSLVDGHLLILPGAYQTISYFGSNIGGISDNIKVTNPNSEFDSWLTIGITDGDPRNKIGTIGIDYDSWTLEHGLSVDDGAVFLMDPNEITIINNELIIARLTIPSSLNSEVIINVQGKLADGSSWKEYDIHFDLTSPQIQDSNSLLANCEVWFDGCNTCQVNVGVLGQCSRLMCFRHDNPYCMRQISGH